MGQGGNVVMKMHIVKQQVVTHAGGEPGLPVIAMHQIELPGAGVAAQPGSDISAEVANNTLGWLALVMV